MLNMTNEPTGRLSWMHDEEAIYGTPVLQVVLKWIRHLMECEKAMARILGR